MLLYVISFNLKKKKKKTCIRTFKLSSENIHCESNMSNKLALLIDILL